jgi:translation initiation factor IF-2
MQVVVEVEKNLQDLVVLVVLAVELVEAQELLAVEMFRM